ncbi:MAG: hypothetical protein ACOWWM_05695 [Desulfobacterales bacterium]
MQTRFNSRDIEKLLAEADALIEQINAGAIEDMETERRIQFELQAQRLEKLRSEVEEKASKLESAESSSYGEGMHKAILDIMAALKNLGGDLT